MNDKKRNMEQSKRNKPCLCAPSIFLLAAPEEYKNHCAAKSDLNKAKYGPFRLAFRKGL